MSNLDSEESWIADGDHPDETRSADKDDDKHGNFEGDEPRARRYSFPLSPTRLRNLPNSLVFERQINDIKEAG